MDWSDRIFWEFSTRYPHRAMVVGLHLELAEAPGEAAVRDAWTRLATSHPRLACVLEGRPPRWSSRPLDLDAHLSFGPLPDLDQDLRAQLTAPLWTCRVDGRQLWFRWHHALSDIEGMIAALASSAPSRPVDRAPLSAKPLTWRRSRWRLRAGSSDISWAPLDPGLSAETLRAWAERWRVTPSDVLVGLAVTALREWASADDTMRAPSLSVLLPMFSLRDASAPVELGNRRASALLEFDSALQPWPALLDRLRASPPRPLPYSASGRVFRLPGLLVDRLLQRVPPVIVNFEQAGRTEGLTEFAGVPVRDLDLRPPPLPHQGCTFAWWTFVGRLRGTLMTDRALIPDPPRLLAALDRAVEQARAA